MPGLSSYAEVAIPLAVHGSFTYAIPEELRDGVRLGSRVEVPLGTKRTTGFVVALTDEAPVEAARVRNVRAILDDDEPALIPEIIELCKWAAEYYLAPLGEMLRVALPANMSARGQRQVTLAGDERLIAAARESKQILLEDLPLLDELRKRPLLLTTVLETTRRSTLDRLRDAGVIAIDDRLRDAKGFGTIGS